MTNKVEVENVVPKLMSLNDLNEVDACNHAEEMTFKDSLGEDTDIKLMVLGAHADLVQADLNKQIDRIRRNEFKSKKQGKIAEPNPAADDIDSGIATVAKRIVGWSGIEDKFTPQNALRLCTQNPSCRGQVSEFSENLGNFGNSK